MGIGPIQRQERGRKWQERLLLTVAAVETAGGAGHNLHAYGGLKRTEFKVVPNHPRPDIEEADDEGGGGRREGSTIVVVRVAMV